MKKRVTSAILLAFNVILCLAIVVLVIMIIKRGAKPVEEVSQQIAEAEQQAAVEEAERQAEAQQQVEEIAAASEVLICIPTSTSSVNVRSGPGTDYQRIGSAYSVNEYVVVGILDNGWTQIDYDGQNGFISSEFIQFKIKSISVETGAEAYMDASESDLAAYRTSNYTVDEPVATDDNVVDYEQEAEAQQEEATDDGILDDEESQSIIDEVTGTEE